MVGVASGPCVASVARCMEALGLHPTCMCTLHVMGSQADIKSQADEDVKGCGMDGCMTTHSWHETLLQRALHWQCPSGPRHVCTAVVEGLMIISFLGGGPAGWDHHGAGLLQYQTIVAGHCNLFILASQAYAGTDKKAASAELSKAAHFTLFMPESCAAAASSMQSERGL